MNDIYDVIIFGGGISGLYIANCLYKEGYNFILIEKDKLGGVQTLASQGMIHGGQKYVLQGVMTQHGTSAASMVSRWEDNFNAKGDMDLSDVEFLSDCQVMFPAGSILSNMLVFAAAKAVNGHTEKMADNEIPQVISRHPVYKMREKVLNIKSLIKSLTKNIEDRIFKGALEDISQDGSVTVSGIKLKANKIIFTAGLGNEEIFSKLGIKGKNTQRRPLRQIMVKDMDGALFGHGVVEAPKPRVTITSYKQDNGKYIWYLGGNIAEKAVDMTADEAILFARQEMQDIFPNIDWSNKDWASCYIERAEPYDEKGCLPLGAHIIHAGNVLIAWGVKMTFAPDLADKIMPLVQKSGNITVRYSPPELPKTEMGSYPWEKADWKKL